MNKIIGGLQSKDKHKPGFENVLDMIKSDSAEIHTVMYSSLYGFILRLRVNEEHSRYNDLAESGDFTIPQTDYILKLTIIDKYVERVLSKNFKDKRKCTNIKSDFLSEAKVQMDIYAKSIIGGNEPICPGIADVQILSNETRDIINFLRLLVDKAQDEDVSKICSYLKTHILSKNYTDTIKTDIVPAQLNLGIITMAIIPDPIGIRSFHTWVVDETTYDNATKIEILQQAYSNAMMQIIVLFYKIGYIHHDLHSGNMIVSKFNSKTMIIDFGRVSKLGDKTSKFFRPFSRGLRQNFLLYAMRNVQQSNSLLKRCDVTDNWLHQFVNDYGYLLHKTIIKSVRKNLPKRLKQPDDTFLSSEYGGISSLNVNKSSIIKQLIRAPIIIDGLVNVAYFKATTLRVQMRWVEKFLYENVLVMVYDKIIPYFVLDPTEEVFGTHKKYISQYIPEYSMTKKNDNSRLFSKYSFRRRIPPIINSNPSTQTTRTSTRSISKAKSLTTPNKKTKTQTRKIRSI
tara:strand:- start:4210 stop:5745 length:1536 start_codon:yes stop_codon:yes gene_type:complete